MRNPFKPTAGATPPLLVGRDEAIDRFIEGIENGPGAPERLTMFTGQRGVGKTVMLNAVADRVQSEFQWMVLDETATPGFLARLTREAFKRLPEDSGRRITGFTLPVVGGGMTFADPSGAYEESNFRQALGALLEHCDGFGTGVLITLDEIHAENLAELTQFAADIQHLVREDRNLAIAFAGLPSAVDELLAGAQITFLRRAERVTLADVPLTEVGAALQETITASGGSIDAPEVEYLAAATEGYPFMIQLVGYNAWRAARGNPIDRAAAAAGVNQARVRLGSLIHAPALKDLSEVDRTFLVAMAKDDGPSRVSEVADRMGKDMSYASVYRQRLLNAGMIRPATWGHVDFALPYLREYLRDHATSLVAGGRQP